MSQTMDTHFAGYDCVKVENDALSLWVTKSMGPRIIGLALKAGENIFAELPDEMVDCPGEGPFHFRGGHRLWHAPEKPSRTYIPDNEKLEVKEVSKGIQVTQPVERQTGIRKSMTITIPNQEARVIVDHSLENLGLWPIECAPWAITQFRPGGVAILPQPTMPDDEHGLLPNRHIVLWPYTQINSPHITWGDRYVFVQAMMQSGALKLGYPNPVGWLGYVLGNTLFVKRAAYLPNMSYFDRECSSECYCNPRFLELETLGPRTTILPGEGVMHQETWELYDEVEFTLDENRVQDLIQSLKI